MCWVGLNLSRASRQELGGTCTVQFQWCGVDERVDILAGGRCVGGLVVWVSVRVGGVDSKPTRRQHPTQGRAGVTCLRQTHPW